MVGGAKVAMPLLAPVVPFWHLSWNLIALLGPPVRAETSTSSQERNLHIFSPQLFLYQHRTQQVSFGWLLGPNKFQLVTCWPSVLV